jgi:O-antigen ligase
MTSQKNNTWSILFALIPFALLFFIALIETDWTIYQKVSKTLLILISDIMLLVLFIIAVFAKKEWFDKKPKYFLYFLLYFVFILIQYLISYISGEISYDANYHFSNYILLLTFALFLFMFLKDMDDVKAGLIFLNIFLLIIFIYSMIEMTGEINSMGNKFSIGAMLSQFRPKLSFGNTDYFSGFMLLILPLAFITPFVFFDSKKSFFKNPLTIVTGIIAILGIIPLILSQTRAALLGIFVGFVFVLAPSIIIMNDKLSKIKKTIIVALMLLALVVLPVFLLTSQSTIVKTLVPRVASTFTNPEFYLNDRLNGWSGGLGLFKNHPAFGAGLGTVYAASFKYMSKYFYIYSDSNSFKHSHNEFIEVLGEGGIFGFIFFLTLLGFIIVSMFRRAYSQKYDFKYRLVCLGVSAGIICMIPHQIFSLSLRMSVTMSAYFFIIGLAIFLISYTRKALIIENPIQEQKKLNKKEVKEEKNLPFYNKPISQKGNLILAGILMVSIFAGSVLFQQVFRCENALTQVVPLGSKDFEQTEYYLKKAVEIMPGNPYAWTYKYTFDAEIKLPEMFKQQNSTTPEEYFARIDSTFDEVIKDLDKINSIIPGYQDVNEKYFDIYFTKYQYLMQKYDRIKDSSILPQSEDCLTKTLYHIDKSLNMNYLNPPTYYQKIAILKVIDNKPQFIETIKDFLASKIYLDIARGKRIVKEKININFSNNEITDLKIKNDKYFFTISIYNIISIAEKLYASEDINSLKNTITTESQSLLSPLYAKINASK